MASPAYLTAVPQNNTNANGSYTGNPILATTALFDAKTKFFVVRHAQYQSTDVTNYTIKLPTSQGPITVPQLGGHLSLHGRDSKFHVVDYDLGGINLLYSSAEIFTWKQYGDHRVLIVYGGPDEHQELAITHAGRDCRLAAGPGLDIAHRGKTIVIGFQTSPQRRIVKLKDLDIHIVGK